MELPNREGRPEYEPTEADRNTVKSMAACGMTQEAIARCLGTDGIDPKTLRKHFRRELDTAMDMANAMVGSVAYRKAMDGESWAVCFWLKTRAGWRETQVMEHAGGIKLDGSATEELASRIAGIASRRATEPDNQQPE